MAILPQTYYTKPIPGARANPLAPINYGLIGWWPFGEGDGIKFHDISGRNRLGTRRRNLGTGGWGGSPSGRSFRVDGATDMIEVTNFKNIPLTSISVVARLNGTGVGGGDFALSHSRPSGNQISWEIATEAGGNLFVVTLSDDGTLDASHRKVYESAGAEFVAFDDTWHTIGFTFNELGSDLKLYVDGRENAGVTKTQDDAISSLFTPTISLEFGSRETADFWAGSYDDVKIYDRALTGREMHILNVNPYSGLLL